MQELVALRAEFVPALVAGPDRHTTAAFGTQAGVLLLVRNRRCRLLVLRVGVDFFAVLVESLLLFVYGGGEVNT
jgi:hypothetical protein